MMLKHQLLHNQLIFFYILPPIIKIKKNENQVLKEAPLTTHQKFGLWTVDFTLIYWKQNPEQSKLFDRRLIKNLNSSFVCFLNPIFYSTIPQYTYCKNTDNQDFKNYMKKYFNRFYLLKTLA